MTDGDLTRPSDVELEGELRAHYRTVGTGSDGPLVGRVAGALDDRLSVGRPVRRIFDRRMLAAAVTGMAALVVLVLVAGPLLFGRGATAGPDGPSPSPTFTPVVIAAQTHDALLSPNPSALGAAQFAWAIGRPRLGGMWSDQDGQVMVNPDWTTGNGLPNWPESDTVPPAVFVLDSQHAWTVTVGEGSSNPWAGQGPGFDHLMLVVNRLAGDGVWRQASVPGDYADSMVSISFVDALHGFMMCSGGQGVVSSTILRTDDGGATWTVVSISEVLQGKESTLGGMFTASDATTLWAGAQGEATGHGHPLLAVSRDAGLTWSSVDLPGMATYIGGFDTMLLDPPTFLDPNIGFVTVFGPAPPTVFMTTDAGRSWSPRNLPFLAQQVFFVDAANWFAPVGNALQATTDAGKTWHSTLGRGLPAGQFYRVTFIDTSTGLALYQVPGQSGHYHLYRTDDGGDTWVLI